jgi:hypothetical protein
MSKRDNKSKTRNPKKETFPHFRWDEKGKHPSLIVGEQEIEEYKFRKVMHGQKDGRHLNEEVFPNPKPNDKDPMYIGKRVRHDKKRNFSQWKYPWTYPPKKGHKKK